MDAKTLRERRRMRASHFLRRRGLEDCRRALPMASAGNLIFALLLGSTIARHLSYPAIASSFTVLMLALALRFLAAARDMSDERSDRARARAAAMLEASSAAVAAGWIIVFATLTPVATGDQLFILGFTACGVMGVEAISLSSLPRAAIISIGGVAMGALYVFAAVDHVIGIALTIALMLMLVRGIIHRYVVFRDLQLRTRASRRTRDIISLFLSQDRGGQLSWVWEVDSEGVLVRANQRFAEAAGRSIADLVGMRLVELLTPGENRDHLEARMARGESFRGLTFGLTRDGETRWWSLSGRSVPGGHDHIAVRGFATDITDAHEAEAKMSFLAHFDSLTGLSNRATFQERLASAVSRCRTRDGLAIMLLDLDRFKEVNDVYGHLVGDDVLRWAAAKLQRACGPGVEVARLGGDEFAIFVERKGADRIASAAAQRILAEFREDAELETCTLAVGVSIGLAVAQRDAETTEELLHAADLALYEAKAKGRRRCIEYDRGMRARSERRRFIEAELRGALTRGELEIHYQPLIDVGSRKALSYEALLRWRHPDRGMVMPNEFIPIAERTGLIVAIGEWVIREALTQLGTFEEGVSVAVNVSAAQVRDGNLVNIVTNALGATGQPGERLELEVTEDVLGENSDKVKETFARLQALGVKIALDDFGTGYASLDRLRQFPFDKVKIDQSFISQLEHSDESLALLRATVDLASSLGITTLAEGVETEEQMARLEREGCTQAQGFLFARALPAVRMGMPPDTGERASLSELASAPVPERRDDTGPGVINLPASVRRS